MTDTNTKTTSEFDWMANSNPEDNVTEFRDELLLTFTPAFVDALELGFHHDENFIYSAHHVITVTAEPGPLALVEMWYELQPD